MTMLKLFGIIIFCGLLWPSQGVLSGLSCAVSPAAVQNVLLNAIVRSGLLHQQVQSLVLPNIMSEGGLLNSPTIITGLHLVKIRVPDLSVTLSGIGVQINIAAKLELSGNCLVGLLSELINILVDVRIAANIKCTNFESGTVQVVVEDCLCVIGGMKIKVLSGLLSLSVNAAVLSHLKGTLPGLLCPVLDIVLNIVNIQLLSTLNVVIPVGTVGTIHYQLASLPFTAGSFLGLDLDGVVKQVGGGIIPHDSSPSALPPLLDKLMVLGVGESFLTAGVSLLLQVPARTFACTPAVCSACGGTSPLSLKLTLSGSPLILLEENKATVKLSVLIHVFIKRADGSILSILLLRADLSLNARLSLSGVRLVLGLSLGRISLFLESSDVGITDVSTLKPHCSSLLGEMFLPLANAALRPGIPLPKVLDIPLVKVEIRLQLGQVLIFVSGEDGASRSALSTPLS
ncbi:PREDICTED: BPI fold-containing family B member 4-like [Merops nubicus]|uniref:BPI fold-containing family B member 4-like n=1 Tax=Merops nubicus TaxID=57421 RepID=UPI0004F011EF|nr:PREDICTED: BPI fold-containing family B member 4-like [Merops nubicus]